MPYFQFTAYTREGQNFEGQEFAASKIELEKRLKARRLILVDCAETRPKAQRRKMLTAFIAQLSPLLNNGIVIDRALQIIAEDATDVKIMSFAQGLRDNVKRGQQLSQAMESAGVNDMLALSIIRAGEASGELPKVVQTLENYFTRQEKLRGEILSALFYPMILIFVSLTSIVLLGLYVIPTFKDLDRKSVV